MIIFDLDGTLADCGHRRHLLKPEDYPKICEYSNYYIDSSGNPVMDLEGKAAWRYKSNGKPFTTGCKSFYEACDKDELIEPISKIFVNLWDKYLWDVQVWSGRCESQRQKTEQWLTSYGLPAGSYLKMRPIGDNIPDQQLKEKWLNERCHSQQVFCGEREVHDIEFVFDSDPESIKMWRRRGVFVFNCAQHDGEF